MSDATTASAPTLSVAMCTFNGEKYLRQQLQSLLDQTYRISELVVFDDNSVDATRNILLDFKNNCEFPVFIHFNQRNVGVVGNFQQAIAGCTGDLIALADQDDVWQPHKIAEVVDRFIREPACGYVFSDAELVDEQGQNMGRTLWKSVGFDAARLARYRGDNQLQTMLRGGNFVYGTTLVFRSKFRSEILPIASKSLACTHDTWIALYLSALGHYGIALPAALVQYRQHASQLFGGGKERTSVEKIKYLTQSRPDIDLAHVSALLALAERIRRDASRPGVQESVVQLTHLATHLRARYRGSRLGRFARLKILLPEIISRRYSQYSSSAMSILKDLLLPARAAAPGNDVGTPTQSGV